MGGWPAYILQNLPGPATVPEATPAAASTTDMMADGLSWITDQLQSFASQPIVYLRGSASVAVSATIGHTFMKLNDGEGGFRFEYTDRDFIIPSAVLILSGSTTTPLRGDTIKEIRNGVRYTYQVFAPGGEQPWRFSDSYRYMLRIHCKLINEEVV